jgi:single-stranded-DNA-specific exonuclease
MPEAVLEVFPLLSLLVRAIQNHFCSCICYHTDIISLSNGNHTKLKLAYGNVTVFGLLFGTKSCDFKYKVNDRIDLLVYPELNSFNGTTSVILRITEYRKSGISQQKFLAQKKL